MIFIFLNADPERIAAAARIADANREQQTDQDQPGWRFQKSRLFY
jgi:hypothetical protein